ncbi:acetate kinase [Rhodoblastus acidophilus]|uniref:acetate/propionate family kinase n=1 Tax=Rhodoblastus acidophilus TaxID=1074 RepID=UPI002225ABD0|nr:acetate/propionate family kinase [Rhodoblastus acidophilus]MCW2284520.1 acetate kinase [Rhodoblastus acidophilus]MCW2333473.1 acetate kinase [Rhodoblastus acidophilus]
MDKGILVLNAGSSSLKFALYQHGGGEKLDVSCHGEIEAMMTAPRFVVRDKTGAEIGAQSWPKPIDAETGLRVLLDWLNKNRGAVPLAACGHRLVQGGERYHGPALVDAEALDYLDGLAMLEPQHQPSEVEGMRAIARIHPELPQVAVFDTSFHRAMPEVSQIYAVPKTVHDAGVKHWGYHGTSYDYINRTLPHYDAGAKKVIVAHLGSGASMCAILDGKSIATTMGFSGIEGLPMGTRSGAIDAGALLYLLRRGFYDDKSLQHMLYEEAGLKGLSGISNDVRTLLASNSPAAKLAIDYFVHRIVYFAGAYAALLGGLDAFVFTAGIGENAAPIRAAVCARLKWLGLDFDAAANANNGPRLSTESSTVRAWVIPTDEEIMIARHTLALIEGAAADAHAQFGQQAP